MTERERRDLESQQEQLAGDIAAASHGDEQAEERIGMFLRGIPRIYWRTAAAAVEWHMGIRLLMERAA